MQSILMLGAIFVASVGQSGNQSKSPEFAPPPSQEIAPIAPYAGRPAPTPTPVNPSFPSNPRPAPVNPQPAPQGGCQCGCGDANCNCGGGQSSQPGTSYYYNSAPYQFNYGRSYGVPVYGGYGTYRYGAGTARVRSFTVVESPLPPRVQRKMNRANRAASKYGP